jgi:hypothetical protein
MTRITAEQAREMQVANACYAMVSGEFARFVNPKNQGLNFDWENWARSVTERCRVEIWLYVPVPRNVTLKNKIADTAAKFGSEISKGLVTYAGFANMPMGYKNDSE